MPASLPRLSHNATTPNHNRRIHRIALCTRPSAPFFITYVDGSSSTGEQYVRAFIRVGEYGTALRRSDLVRDENEGKLVWRRPETDIIVYVEGGPPRQCCRGPSGAWDYDGFVSWIEQQRSLTSSPDHSERPKLCTALSPIRH